MTRVELIEFLGEAESTVDEWRKRPDFPRGKRYPNRKIKYDPAEIAAWVESFEDAA